MYCKQKYTNILGSVLTIVVRYRRRDRSVAFYPTAHRCVIKAGFITFGIEVIKHIAYKIKLRICSFSILFRVHILPAILNYYVDYCTKIYSAHFMFLSDGSLLQYITNINKTQQQILCENVFANLLIYSRIWCIIYTVIICCLER